MSSVSEASALVEMPWGYQLLVALVVVVPAVGLAHRPAEQPGQDPRPAHAGT